MKRIFLIVCVLLLMSPVVTGQPAWDPYTIKYEEFSVDLPTLPAMTSSVTLHPRLQKNRMERHLTTLLDGVVYSIDVFENPEPGQSLEDFIAEQNVNSSYDLTTGRDLMVNDLRGKEYSSRDATSQFFAGPRRLYRFTARRSDGANAAVSQFFSSIKFGKPRNATEVVDGPGRPLVLDTGERIYTGREVTTKPHIISKLEPQYTNEARKNRVSGTVILRVLFSKTGDVTDIYVVEGLPQGLTEACIEVAKQIKFTPATKDGSPVSMWMQLEYRFFI